MMYFKRRRQKKLIRQVLHEAVHARNMREDVSEPDDIAALNEAIQAASELDGDSEEKDVETRLNAVTAAVSKVNPARPYPRIRENVEIFAVAIIVAMGFRTYFVQPFKIPTGSMEPTLYGINVDPAVEPTWADKPPFRYAKFLITGDRFVQIKAKTDGYVSVGEDRVRRQLYLVVSQGGPGTRGVRHKYYQKMKTFVRAGERVRKGQVMAQGMISSGDHIFVDKVRYNFTKPKRGQVIVFRTEDIEHRDILPTDHYIKRLVGLPGETIRIDSPHLVVDGERVTEPYGFHRLLNDERYAGYSYSRPQDPTGLFPGPHASLSLEADEFLPFGDNTNSSLDGRYFGGVSTDSLLGPAFVVYWPFGPRWGRVR